MINTFSKKKKEIQFKQNKIQLKKKTNTEKENIITN